MPGCAADGGRGDGFCGIPGRMGLRNERGLGLVDDSIFHYFIFGVLNAVLNGFFNGFFNRVLDRIRNGELRLRERGVKKDGIAEEGCEEGDVIENHAELVDAIVSAGYPAGLTGVAEGHALVVTRGAYGSVFEKAYIIAKEAVGGGHEDESGVPPGIRGVVVETMVGVHGLADVDLLCAVVARADEEVEAGGLGYVGEGADE